MVEAMTSMITVGALVPAALPIVRAVVLDALTPATCCVCRRAAALLPVGGKGVASVVALPLAGHQTCNAECATGRRV